MQPRRLHMKNFGPFIDEIVDFGAFADQGLFLVSGKTGAGKTTIFDGMTFALFGQTSGKLRSGKEMRSLFAQPAEETEVTFSFSHGGLLYEVMRRPEQEVAKKRGTGTTKRAGKTTLTVFDTLGNEKKQYTKNVDDELYQMLHLNADQFFKIIMLPQGEFRNFLIASSTDKEQVLRRLFDTEIYQNLQTWLKEQATLQNKSIEAKRLQAEALVDSFKWFEKISVLPSLAETKQAWERDLCALQQAVKEQDVLVSELNAKKNTAEKQYYQAEELKKTFDELEKAIVHETVLADKKIAIAEKIKEQNWLSWLQQQAPLVNSLKMATEKVQLQADKLIRTKNEAKKNTAALSIWESQRMMFQEKAADLELAKKTLHNLEVKLPQAELLEEKQQVFTAQAAELSKMFHRMQELEQNIINLKETLAQQEAITQQSGPWQKTMLELAKIQQLVVDFEKLQNNNQTMQTELRNILEAIQTQQLNEQQLKLTGEAALTEYTLQKSNYAKAMIARLSLDLKPGEACPVCGATEHPDVALHAKEKLSVQETESALNLAEKKLRSIEEQQIRSSAEKEQLEKECDKVNRQLAEQDTAICELKTKIERKFDALTGKTDYDDVLVALSSFVEKQEQLGQEISAATEKKVALEQKLIEHNQVLVTWQKRHQEQNNGVEQLKGEIASLKEQVGNLTAPLLRQQISEITQKISTFVDQLQTDQVKGENLKATAKSYAVQIKEIMAYQQDAVLEEESLAEKLQVRLATAPRKIAKSDLLTAEVDEAQLKKIATEIKDYENDILLIKEQKQKLQAKVMGKEKPAIKELATVYEHAQLQLSESQQRCSLLKAQQKDNQQLLEKLALLLQSHESSLAALAEIEQLSQVLSGKNTYKTSLERYVLQAYLAEILDVANVRLQQLTNGRYQFSLAEKSDGGRGQKGLDIDIYDDNAGQTRRVQTLSGGESFIAALALALSLADVIQNRTGGIALDALFIDEGFGSLDEEALEMALEALSTLETEGRLIGIISHVPVLKEKIVRQINVKTNGAGQSQVALKID
ncbi:MAG: SMC family ATPase [Enterococcus sp.]|uniref:SMC family ATPase n=3 Tax=Enterococcus sp. TaxID=35783 RepID=UPI002FC9ABAF